MSEFTPSCGPVPQRFRMIAPFWADVDARNTGDIFYRQTTNSSILKKAQQELETAFSDIKNLQLEWALVATWHNVTYFIDLDDSNEKTRKRNTFQATLVTDGAQSFAIFYYNEITWTTGDASGGTNGLGGTAAEVGYDYGDGVHYLIANGSCTPAVLNFTLTSNVNSPGKWIFRTNTLVVTPSPPPDCRGNYTGDFCVVPNKVDTIGHTALDITNIQLTSTDTALCRFYDPYANVTEVQANIITLTHIQCYTPFFYTTGRLQFEVEIQNNNRNQTLTGYLYVNLPQTDTLSLQVLSNGSILFKWDPNKLDEGEQRDGIWHFIYMHVCEIGIDIVQFCYDDVVNAIICVLCKRSPLNCLEHIVEPYIIKTIDDEIAKLGEYLLHPIKNIPEIVGPMCKLDDMSELLCTGGWYLGKLAGDLFTNHPLTNMGEDAARVLGEICPGVGKICQAALDAYGLLNNKDELGEEISDDKSSTPKTPILKIPTDVPPCPPTLELAQLDPRFVVDPHCPGGKACFLNQGADICYDSATPSPSGGGQHCCYKSGNIFLKTPGAGYPYVTHPSIAASFPNLIRDINPLVFCCYATDHDEEECQKYYQERPPDTGANYTAPKATLGNGDPHWTTFDELYYTFNGAGEFWLLKDSLAQPLAAQVRMILPYGPASTFTFLAAYALKAENGSIVQVSFSHLYSDNNFFEVEINPLTYLIDVYYDGVPIPPDVLQNKFTHGDVSILLQDGTVSVTLGVGFSFQFSQLSLIGYAPITFKGNFTHGLLGTYDGNPFNDLETPYGVIVPANSTTEIVHLKFGLDWYVQEDESLFDYFGKNYSDYYFPNFRPNFGYAASQLPPDAAEICGGDPSCLWDLVITGDPTIANQTRGTQEGFNNTVSTTSKNITMCPRLSNPTNGYLNIDYYNVGGTAEFSCYPGYEVDGSSVLYCQKDGTWNGTIPECLAIQLTKTEEATTNPSEKTTKQTAVETTSITGASSKIYSSSKFALLIGLMVIFYF
uniref:Uncharacterized protein n=1 Tax=Acrobeloides nanus TaxID=290746 RepID=A0A914EJJ9_9BILA